MAKKYPERAGYTEPTTSKDAADAIEESGQAETLRGSVLHWLRSGHTGTTEEIADAIGGTYEGVQPRVSELRKQGLVEHTGIRRPRRRSRVGSHVWRIASKQGELFG